MGRYLYIGRIPGRDFGFLLLAPTMDAPLPLAHRRRRRVRAAAAAVVAALIAVALAVVASRLDQRLSTVPRAQLWTGSVTRGDFAMRVQGAGVLRPEAVRWLTAESPGRVEAVLVKPGTRVTPDTVLVRLENLDLRLQTDEALRDVQASEAQALALEHQQGQDEFRLEQELSVLANDLADATRRATAYQEGAGLIVARNESERERDRAAALGEQVAASWICSAASVPANSGRQRPRARSSIAYAPCARRCWSGCSCALRSREACKRCWSSRGSGWCPVRPWPSSG
jgi:hypothetical protein